MAIASLVNERAGSRSALGESEAHVCEEPQSYPCRALSSAVCDCWLIARLPPLDCELLESTTCHNYLDARCVACG